MPMPGEPTAYEGDCGVTPTPTNTVSGSGAGPVGPEGMHEIPFAGGGETNILASGGHEGHGGFAIPGTVPD
jgi:hypothetical protein